MKRFFPTIFIVFLMISGFNFIFSDNGDSFILEVFTNDLGENIITFNPGGNSDNSTRVRIQKGAPVYEAFINVTGMPDAGGNYPTNVTLDVGNNSVYAWKFQGLGYGPLGKQTAYNDSVMAKKIIVPPSGYELVGKLKLPRNATVTKATFDVVYSTGVMYLQPALGAGKDTVAVYETPNTNYGTDQNLQQVVKNTMAFLEFDLSSMSPSIDISTAFLELYSPWWGNQQIYSAHRVLGSWSETGVTWNNVPPIDPSAMSTAVYNVAPLRKSFNISAAAINWKSGTWTNYGIAIKETLNQTDEYITKSNDFATPSQHPRVLVNYIDYPVDPGIKIGVGTGAADWSYAGKLKSIVTTTDLKTQINNYLAAAGPGETDIYGNELVQIPVYGTGSNNGSFMSVGNIQVEYDHTVRINITSDLNFHVPADPTNEIEDVDIPLEFSSTSAGKLKVDSLYVSYNERPVMQSPSDPLITEIPDQYFPEDSDLPRGIDLGYYFMDDRDVNTSLTFSVVQNTNPAGISVMINPLETNYLHVASMFANWSGETKVIVDCTDSGDRMLRSNEFTIFIGSENDKPMARDVIPDITMNEDRVYDSIGLDRVSYFVDAEGDEIYYDYDIDPFDVISDEALSVEIDFENKLIITALDNYNGDDIPIWIYADDGIYPGQPNGTEVAKYGSGKPFVYQEVLVDITPVNDAPFWKPINDTYIDEDIDIDNAFRIYDVVYDLESPTGELTFSVSLNENKSKINVVIDENKYIDISFAEEHYNGRTFVALLGEDDEGAKSYGTFNIIVNPINDLPVIEVNSPTAGQKVQGKINLVGMALDVDGTVEKVEVKIDDETDWRQAVGSDTWNYQWDTSGYAAGPHNVYLRAQDDLGEYSSEFIIELNVIAIDTTNNKPSVFITSPDNGTTVNDGKVTIKGTAIDIDGSIKKVQIKIADGEWQDAVGSIDWSYEINTKNLSNGAYTIHVRSFDGDVYSKEKSTGIIVVNVDGPGIDVTGDDTDDKEGGGLSNMLYIVIALVIIIFIVVAVVIVMKKKKPEDAAQEVPEASSSEVAAQPVPELPELPAIPPLPTTPPPADPGVQPQAPAPEPVPQPAPEPSYPAPTHTPEPAPAEPQAQAELPAEPATAEPAQAEPAVAAPAAAPAVAVAAPVPEPATAEPAASEDPKKKDPEEPETEMVNGE